MKTFDGFKVELASQVLYAGEWDKDDCEWDWETEDYYFFDEVEAEQFFKKQRRKCNVDTPIISLYECLIEYEYGKYFYYPGDLIAEMANTDSGVEVWWRDK